MKQIKPKRKYLKRNKGVAAAYYKAYKTIAKTLSKEDLKKVLDPNDNGKESQAFVKAVIAMAEQDFK